MTKKIILLTAIVILLLTVWLGSTVYFTLRSFSQASAAARLLANREQLLVSVLGPADQPLDKPPIPYDHPGGQAAILSFSEILDGRKLTVSCGISTEPGLHNSEGPYEIAIFTNNSGGWTSSNWGPSVVRNISIYAKTNAINPGDTLLLNDLTDLYPSANSLLFVRYKPLTIDGKPGNILLGIAVTPQELAYAKSQGQNGTADLIQKLKDNGIFPVSYLHRGSVVDPRANLVTPLEGRNNRAKMDLNTPAAVAPTIRRSDKASANSNNNSGSRKSRTAKQTPPDADDDENE